MLFINKYESYFQQQRTMAEEHVWMASYNLEDVAQLWYIQLQEDEGTPPWGRFRELLNLRFGPPLRAAPLFELTECRRTGTVEEYANRFQALLPRTGRLDEAQRVQLFTGGLLPPLSHVVRIHNPATLAAAMSLARQVELMELDKMAHATTRAGPRAPPTASGPRPAPALLAAPALPALPALLALPAPLALLAPPVRGAPVSAKRLAPDEQAERRRLGLCYNCNEPYSRGHNRVCLCIFYIDGMEIADDAPAAGDANPTNQDAPVFSLRAVAGMPICDTMQVRVVVGAAAFIALLDTGSTHNFIAEDAARRTGLAVHVDPRLTTTVANDERISCPGVLRQAPISIAGEEFRVDLYMPLAGYDLVLGTQWMVTLGPIVWDFTARTMAFTRRDRAVCWTDVGAREAPLLVVSSSPTSLLEELLFAFAGTFVEPSGLPP
jgi:hypothetical protein